jgi:Flp pilus assembly protein TadG
MYSRIRMHCHYLKYAFPDNLAKLFRNESGAAAILVALAAPMLAGTMGLAAEASYWYMHKRAMQNAADGAAIAAATAGEVNGSSAYQPEAKSVAARFGFTDGSGNVTVTAANPGTATNCTSGCYTVTVQDQVPLFLSKVINYGGTNNSGLTTLSASAVATVWGGTYCILALNGSVTQDLVANGAPKSNLTGCDIMANSGANCNGHNLGAPIGDAHGTNNGCGIIQNSNVPTLADPFARLASNIPANTCGGIFPLEPLLPALNLWSDLLNLGPYNLSGYKIVCGDLKLVGDTTINAPNNAVLVIVNGQLDTSGHTLKTSSGSGLTIVFTGDPTNSTYNHYPSDTSHGNPGGTLDIAAPTSGPWSGIALYQDPNLVDSGNPGNLDISAAGNRPTWNISGMVYLPHSNVTLSGAVNKSGTGASCFGMTVGSLTINGTGDIFANPGDTAQCKAAGLTLPHHRGTLVN